MCARPIVVANHVLRRMRSPPLQPCTLPHAPHRPRAFHRVHRACCAAASAPQVAPDDAEPTVTCSLLCAPAAAPPQPPPLARRQPCRWIWRRRRHLCACVCGSAIPPTCLPSQLPPTPTATSCAIRAARVLTLTAPSSLSERPPGTACLGPHTGKGNGLQGLNLLVGCP